ncbi:MAG: sugar transferase [Dehalococcoidia bacterium]|nr:sugar transferase [Dehalococcoidia bacterium]
MATVRSHLSVPAGFIPRARPLPWWKRSIDVAVSAVGLVLLAPFFGLVAIVVRLDSAGSAFFGQERMGANGSTFICWKFRSMHQDAEAQAPLLAARNQANGLIFKMKDDPRRTRVGKVLRKTSIDELPQLWNVLRGEMSLVGPRPPLPSEVERYEPEHWARLRGVPGITGLWQVRARHRHDFTEMLEMDLEYLEDISPVNDLRILLLTIPAVLMARGSH